MIDISTVLRWDEIEHDLYEENDRVFGVEIDLFNGHQSYYCKTVENGKTLYHFYASDIYEAIELFNEML